MSSQVRARRRVEKSGVRGDGYLGLVEVEFEIGKSGFISAIYTPSEGGYVEVSVEPVEKRWLTSKSGVAKYKLPEGSVVIYKVVDGKVSTKAYLVTRSGLRELEVESTREIVDNVGGRDVYVYVDIVKAPLGEIRQQSNRFYVHGVGLVTSERLGELKEQSKYMLSVFIDPLFLKPARKLSDEEFKKLLSIGLKYRDGGFIVPVDDIDVDEKKLEEIISFLKENTHGFRDEHASVIREKWRKAEQIREIKRIIGEITGVKVAELEPGLGGVLLTKTGIVVFKPEHVGDEKFKELLEKYEYFGGGVFAVDVCSNNKLLEVVKKTLSETSIKTLSETCVDKEWAKRRIREKLGLEPLIVRYSLDYNAYKVKFPRIDKDKFRELARKYKYDGGYFYISKAELEQ